LNTRLELQNGKIILVQISDDVNDLIESVILEAWNNDEPEHIPAEEICWSSYLECALSNQNIEEPSREIWDRLISEIMRRW
jgi:hypothetical protein